MPKKKSGKRKMSSRISKIIKNKKKVRAQASKKMKKRVDEAKAGNLAPIFNGISEEDLFEIKKGRNVLDVIPYVDAEGGLEWMKKFAIHYNLGPEGKTGTVCRRSMGYKDCPACDLSAKFAKNDDLDEKERLQFRPRNKVLIYAVDRKNKKAGPKILYISPFLLTDAILTQVEIEEEEGIDVSTFYWPDPNDGFTIKVFFKEDSFAGQKFLKAANVKFVKRKEDTWPLVEKLKNLDETIKVLSVEEIENLTAGISIPSGDIDDDEDTYDYGDEEDVDQEDIDDDEDYDDDEDESDYDDDESDESDDPDDDNDEEEEDEDEDFEDDEDDMDFEDDEDDEEDYDDEDLDDDEDFEDDEDDEEEEEEEPEPPKKKKKKKKKTSNSKKKGKKKKSKR